MKICYVEKKFNAEASEAIVNMDRIVANYAAQGYNLTTRQVYYKFVSNGLFRDSRRYSWTGKKWVLDPSGTTNAAPNYSWLQGLLNDARLAGLVDWDAIVDRTRYLESQNHWKHPRDVVRAAQQTFALDKWANQANYVEVWVEKDALKDIIGQACEPLDVPYFSCRGYSSVTALHDAAHRLARRIGKGQEARIIHLGDHDPSGMDMTRDISDRIKNIFGVQKVHIHRVALNMNQIEQYQPPSDPAKMTDSRCSGYIKRFGDRSWELDALEPDVLHRVIQSNILHWCDKKLFDATKAREDRAKATIETIANRWNEVLKVLQKPTPKPKTKCDGNHGAPNCDDPECWQPES